MLHSIIFLGMNEVVSHNFMAVKDRIVTIDNERVGIQELMKPW